MESWIQKPVQFVFYKCWKNQKILIFGISLILYILSIKDTVVEVTLKNCCTKTIQTGFFLIRACPYFAPIFKKI